MLGNSEGLLFARDILLEFPEVVNQSPLAFPAKMCVDMRTAPIAVTEEGERGEGGNRD